MDYGCVPAYHDPADADAEETVAVLECENCRKACEKLHHVPEFDYMGCDACMEEATILSASQASTFPWCSAKWWFRYGLGLPDPRQAPYGERPPIRSSNTPCA
jgi:hypothetical protein